MCGIFGLIATRSLPNAPALEEHYRKSLYNRGPDSFRIYREPNLLFGISRLAITDRTSDTQPFVHPRTNTITIFNGEIYNYKSLRSLLSSKGITLVDGSEVEVISQLFELYGPSFTRYLDGMYAIAIYSHGASSCYLFRDTYGIKPLFWTTTDHFFSFSSDAYSLAKTLPDTKLSQMAFYEFLYHGNLSNYSTPFENIHRLHPGYYLHFSNNAITTEPAEPFRRDSYPNDSSEDDLKQQILSAFTSQIPSDQSYAVSFSGGIDSSLLALASKTFSSFGFEPEIYTVAFDSKPASIELQAADYLAQQFNLKYHKLSLTTHSSLSLLQDTIRYLDEPTSDTGIIGLALISQAVAEDGHKVLLCGTGADEVFYGYARHLPPRLISGRTLNSLPTVLRSLCGPLLSRLFKGSTPVNLDPFLYYLASISGINPFEVSKLHPEISFSSLYFSKHPLSASSQLDIRKLDEEYYLSGQLLPYTDKVSMLHSVECRVPYLSSLIDKHLVRRPSGINLQTKPILREALYDFVGSTYQQPPKDGFNAGIQEWPQEFFKSMQSVILASSIISGFGISRCRLFEFCQLPLTSSIRQLTYNLYVFAIWAETHQ